MDKAEICNLVRSHYPKAFGIRKKLQAEKVKRVRRHLMTPEEIARCEKDAAYKHELVAQYARKQEKQLRPIRKEMELVLSHSAEYGDRANDQTLRDDILFCRMAYGFLPSEYTGFELENRTPEERKKFVSDLDTFVFGYSVNDISILQSIVDKGRSTRMFGKYFGRDYLEINKKTKLDDFLKFVEKNPIFVKKKTNSSQGKNIELVDIRTVGKKPEEYFAQMTAAGKFLLEERVFQHATMASFNSSSVNTIRCMTMKTRQGVIVPYCFMRTGRSGSFVDNGGSGGILIGIDVQAGALNTHGYDEYKQCYPEHPDTHLTFKGWKIPAWEEMLDFCKTAASKVDGIGFLSWDMAYTDRGWVVIEVNGIGQLIGPQTVNKRGIKEELDKYSAMMEKVI